MTPCIIPSISENGVAPLDKVIPAFGYRRGALPQGGGVCGARVEDDERGAIHSASERGNPARDSNNRVAVIGHFQMLLTLKLSTLDP